MRPLTEDGVEFLRSARAQSVLAELDPANALSAVERLRGDGFDADQAAWLLDQARLRGKARGRFIDPQALLFHAEALQQASSVEVADWRADRFSGRVLDLGAGIGGDTLALARAGCDVVAVERDPVRAALLRHNVEAAGLSAQVEVHTGDWTARGWEADAAFADPARRVEGKRVLGLEAMAPPLSALLELTQSVADVLVKVAPGLDVSEVPPSASLEMVSLRGELKEALLAFGGLQRAAGPVATVIDADGAHDLAGEGERAARVAAPGAFWIEPDPAVIRTRLVRELGARLDAWQVDAQIAYLSSDALPRTPFARVWRVLRHGAFGRKPLTRWLRDDGAGRVTVKTRGVPVDGPALAKRLPRQKGGPERTVFVTRTDDGPLMVLAALEASQAGHV